jgi:hypothetical protein
MTKSRWIVKRSEDGEFLAAEVTRKKQFFHCSAVQILKDPKLLTGPVNLALESSKAVVLVEEFPDVKNEIMQLLIHQSLDRNALLEPGEKFSISNRLLEERRQKKLLSIIAQPESLTLDSITKVTHSSKVHLECCVPSVAAVTALLAQLGPDPYIVLLITKHSAFLIGVRAGCTLFLQSIPLSAPAEVESGVAAHAIGFGRQTLDRDFEIDSCKLICLGEGRDSFDFKTLEEENWVPDWSHCLQAQGNDIILHPALFGSLFTGNTYSYLSSKYIIASRLKKAAANLTALTAVAGIILGYFSYSTFNSNKPLLLQRDKETKALSQAANNIRKDIPDPLSVIRIASIIDTMHKVQTEPSAADLLRNIALVLPEDVVLNNLTIYRETPAGSAMNESSTEPPPTMGMAAMPQEPEETVTAPPAVRLLSKQLVINMDCVSHGEYSHVKARFDQTVAGLSSRFLLRNVDWDYTEQNQMGSFHCELIFTGERI